MGGRRASRSLADGGDGHGARPQTCGLCPETPGSAAVEGKGSEREEPSTALLTWRTGCHRLKWRVQEEKQLWGVGDAGRRRPKGNTSRVGTVGSITCVEFFSLSLRIHTSCGNPPDSWGPALCFTSSSSPPTSLASQTRFSGYDSYSSHGIPSTNVGALSVQHFPKNVLRSPRSVR